MDKLCYNCDEILTQNKHKTEKDSYVINMACAIGSLEIVATLFGNHHEMFSYNDFSKAAYYNNLDVVKFLCKWKSEIITIPDKIDSIDTIAFLYRNHKEKFDNSTISSIIRDLIDDCDYELFEEFMDLIDKEHHKIVIFIVRPITLLNLPVEIKELVINNIEVINIDILIEKTQNKTQKNILKEFVRGG